MNNKNLKPEGKGSSRRELYSAIVWIFAGLSLVAYGITGFVNASIPGVEELVAFLYSVEGKYIYLAAFVSIFIEGIYFIGNFFPGSTLIVILALFSQLAGAAVFIGTILAIFAGWCLAGIVNILFANIYRSKIARLQEDDEYKIKDRLWTTWFPAFRANYEVAQIVDGGNPLKVFLSSVRVKSWASIAAALFILIIPLFVDINEVSNEEGFVTVAVVAVISFVVGAVRLRRYFK
jgi:hypothetical protein